MINYFKIYNTIISKRNIIYIEKLNHKRIYISLNDGNCLNFDFDTEKELNECFENLIEILIRDE